MFRVPKTELGRFTLIIGPRDFERIHKAAVIVPKKQREENFQKEMLAQDEIMVTYLSISIIANLLKLV